MIPRGSSPEDTDNMLQKGKKIKEGGNYGKGSEENISVALLRLSMSCQCRDMTLVLERWQKPGGATNLVEQKYQCGCFPQERWERGDVKSAMPSNAHKCDG